MELVSHCPSTMHPYNLQGSLVQTAISPALPLLPQMPVIKIPQKVNHFLHRAHLTPIRGNNVEPGQPWLLAGLGRCRFEDPLERICAEHHITRQRCFLEIRSDLLLKATEDP